MASDDEERTVFGQKLPPQAPAPQAPPVDPRQPPQSVGQQYPQGQPPAGGGDERTVFGQRIPPQQPPPHQHHQPPPSQQHDRGGPPPGTDDTWLGGRLTPQQGRAPAQQPQYQQPPHQPYAPTPPPQPYQPPPSQGYQPPPQPAPQYPPTGHAPPPAYPGWTPAAPPIDGQFPPTGPQGGLEQPMRDVPRIAFSDALRGAGLEIGTASNPILAAASDLLVLLGRLRTGMVEMQAIPLRDHVLREVDRFVFECKQHNVAPEDIDVARYALAATADDIVQTIPGNDPQYWQQFSMAAELLNDRSAGIGFFAHLEQVIAFPQQRAHVLELMLTCLALGFEGKYRTEPNGQVMLSRVRNEVYQRFRAGTKRPETGLSHKWLPVLLGGRRRGGAIPLWVLCSFASAMVVALFATLSWILSSDAQAAHEEITRLHAGLGPLSIEGDANARTYEAAPTGQLERIRGRLADEIEQKVLAVEEVGDFITVRLSDALRFGSGSADLTTDVSALAKTIADALEAEPGEIIIEGHSDNVRLRGTGRYKTNEALSEARAGTVRDLLAPLLSDPARMSVVGVGPAKPLDPANTKEARAKNRRVEILLRKEQRI